MPFESMSQKTWTILDGAVFDETSQKYGDVQLDRYPNEAHRMWFKSYMDIA